MEFTKFLHPKMVTAFSPTCKETIPPIIFSHEIEGSGFGPIE